MAPIRKPKVPLVRPGEKVAAKPKEKPNTAEIPKASHFKASTHETDMTDPETSEATRISK
jgi:hypothetical protein